MTFQVEEITIDLINRMKRDGRWDEASALIKAHHEHMRRNRSTDKIFTKKLFQKVEVIVCHNKGICTNCKKRPVIKNKFRCQICRNYDK